jgi:hypothetical protein
VDVEETIEFILEQQARTEAALARMAEREDNTEALLRRAIRAGVEEVRRQRVRSRRLDEKITQLAAAQVVTEEKLQGLIDSIRQGGNGRH